jgi:hypothetical protein
MLYLMSGSELAEIFSHKRDESRRLARRAFSYDAYMPLSGPFRITVTTPIRHSKLIMRPYDISAETTNYSSFQCLGRNGLATALVQHFSESRQKTWAYDITIQTRRTSILAV